MRYREVFINGQVFLEIVDDHEEREPPRREQDQSELDREDEPNNGTWIGELVPHS